MGRSIVRLKDIADKTGFSTNTVSLALRQSPRIPQQTRDIIQRAATELNYLPNQIAKSLVSRETKTIGLVLTDITNPTLTHTAQAMFERLGAAGVVAGVEDFVPRRAAAVFEHQRAAVVPPVEGGALVRRVKDQRLGAGHAINRAE